MNDYFEGDNWLLARGHYPGDSIYPISKPLRKLILNSGYSEAGVLMAMGHQSVEELLPGLQSWLKTGEGPASLLDAIAAAYPDDAEGLRKAVRETAEMKAAGVDPIALERQKAEREFPSFILAEGEAKRPSQIVFFAVTGGYERWHMTQIPRPVLDLPVEEQLTALPEFMEAFRQQHKGSVPFFGKLIGFKFVRLNDFYTYSKDGKLLEHVNGQFPLAAAWAELR